MARGGATTDTTCIRPYKQVAGLSAVQTMEERFSYGLNPQKLGAVSSHLCGPATAAARFAETACRAGGAVTCWGAVLCRSPAFRTSGHFVPKVRYCFFCFFSFFKLIYQLFCVILLVSGRALFMKTMELLVSIFVYVIEFVD